MKQERLKLTSKHLAEIPFARDWTWSGNGGHQIFYFYWKPKKWEEGPLTIMKTFLINLVLRLVQQGNYLLFPVNIETQLNKLKVVKGKN